MKRCAAMLVALALAAGLCGCGGLRERAFNGEVVAYGGNPLMLELACEDGSNYGFIITKDTKLSWEEESAQVYFGEDAPGWTALDCEMSVSVIAGEAAQSPDPSWDECVEEWYYAREITVVGVDGSYFATAEKPVIYLYPEETTEVEVLLEVDGELTCTYPGYDEGWRVTAHSDGTLTDRAGQSYNYLYWEGVTQAEYDFSRGFCVAGEDTAAFLEQALEQLGLTRREANEFIVYWLPYMEGNAYNLISFQTDAYTDSARLTIRPQPDTVLRVFMAWQALEEPVHIPAQTLTPPERTGFVVVEWGGAEVRP